MGNTAVIIGCFREGTIEGVIKGLKEANSKIKRAGYIEGNTRGCGEIYIELPSDKDAKQFAMEVQMLPAPIRGVHMALAFDDIIKSPNFKTMGGRVIKDG